MTMANSNAAACRWDGKPRARRLLLALGTGLALLLQGLGDAPLTSAADRSWSKEDFGNHQNEAAEPEAEVDVEEESSGISSESKKKFNQFDYLIRVADEALVNQDLATAANLYLGAHNLRPDDPMPLRQLLTVYRAAGHTQGVPGVQARLWQLTPSDNELGIEYGLSLLRQGRGRDARIVLHAVLDRIEDPRIFNGLGVSYDMEGKHREAQAYYRIALEMKRGYQAALGNLGLSLAIVGEFGDSIMILSQLREPRPEQKELLAAVHALAGDMAAARTLAGENFDKAAAERAAAKHGLQAKPGETVAP